MNQGDSNICFDLGSVISLFTLLKTSHVLGAPHSLSGIFAFG